MSILRTWGRSLLLALSLLVIAPEAFAARHTSRSPTTDVSRTDSPYTAERQPAGSPEFGVIIIVGIVGFVVLLAWIFSRVGEGNSRAGDNTLN
jgi:hypothetical protein